MTVERVAARGNRWAALLGIAAGLGVAALLALFGGAQRLDAPLFDVEMRALRAVYPRAAEDIVIVGIDDATLAAVDEPLSLFHRVLANVLNTVADDGPRIIVLDVVLPDRSRDALLPGADTVLTQALVRARSKAPLVLAIQDDPYGRPRGIHPAFLAAAGENAVGYARFPVDADQVVRRYDLQLVNGQPAPTLVSRVAELAGRHVSSGWIDWSIGAPFNYVSLQSLLGSQTDPARADVKRTFRGKIVLIGSVLPDVDRIGQPVALAGWESGRSAPPGIVLNAQALRTALAGGFVPTAPAISQCLLAVLLALVAAVPRVLLRWLLLAGVLGASFCVASWLFVEGCMLPLGAAWSCAFVAVSARTALDAWLHRRERQRLTQTFGGYVSPQVLSAIMDGRLTPAGGRRMMAFLFADLRGFTALSERTGPERVLGLLNRYYAMLTPIVHGELGTIDNFRGDGVMVMFGAPERIDNPSSAALCAAQKIIDGLDALNLALRTEGGEAIVVSIGVAFGDAIYGDLGSTDRKDFTALGDAVNVAARLQDLAKDLGYALVVTAEALNRSGWTQARRDDFVDLGVQAIKGHSPIHVFGWKPV